MKRRLARALRRLANRLEPQQWEIRTNCGTFVTGTVKTGAEIGRELEDALAHWTRRQGRS